jgi:hypothetical protein
MREIDVSPGRKSSPAPNAARRAIARISPGVAAVLLCLLPRVVFGSPPENPHAHFAAPETCPMCHVTSRGGTVPDRFSTGADALCLSCHRKESLGRTHPVGIRPADRHANRNRIPPADLRLDEDGRMMCLTCHSGHGPHLSTAKAFPSQAPEIPAAGGRSYYKTFFLRRSSAENGFAALCQACHEKP